MQMSLRWVAVALALLLLTPVLPSMSVRAQEDFVKVVTDYEMLGLQELHGGGHLTYTLEGSAARDLRRRVLAAYDGSVTPFLPNGGIDAAELGDYAAEVEDYLEQRIIFFAGTTISFRLLHRGGGEPVTTDFEGFVGVDVNTTAVPIKIFFYFDSRAIPGEQKPSLIPQEFFEALYVPFQGRISNYEPWEGDYIFEHMDYRVGVISYWETEKVSGSIYVFRTPAGEVVSYSARFQYDNEWLIPQDKISYSSFNFLENPQVLFILIFVCGYLLSSIPNRMFAAYKLAHPRRMRHKAKRILWLHILNKVLILLLLIFYFVPNIAMLFGSPWFFSGMYLWVMAPLLTVVIGVTAKVLYDRAAKKLPEEVPLPPRRIAAPAEPGVRVVVEPSGAPAAPAASHPVPVPATPTGPLCTICKQAIHDEKKMVDCECGRAFHSDCVKEMKKCPFCEAYLPGKAPKAAKIQCPTCGEINEVPEGSDLMEEKCKACGVPLETLEPGYNYLIVAGDRSIAYELLVGLVRSKKLIGLCITTTFPDKVRKEHDLGNTEVIWLSDTSGDAKILNPKRLEFETMRTIGNFVKGRKDAVLMLDGFEYLVVENGFDKVLKFIKKINDLCSVNQATFIVPMGSGSATPDQMATLRKEFDQVIEVEG
ncbi:MAG: DUF835 domain-containing protein [Candidatus Thermoplasmatota archaeon]